MTRPLVLAVDPGVRKAGYALFGDDGALVEAGTVTARGARATAAKIAAIAAARGCVSVAHIEKMRKYTARSATHRDLDRVEVMVRALSSSLRRGGAAIARVYPSVWKGNVPKAVCQRRILTALAPTERAAVLDSGHDTYDAIGIGLVCIGRLRRGLV